MILFNDEVHSIAKKILEDCKLLDQEDDSGTITLVQLNELLDKVLNIKKTNISP